MGEGHVALLHELWRQQSWTMAQPITKKNAHGETSVAWLRTDVTVQDVLVVVLTYVFLAFQGAPFESDERMMRRAEYSVLLFIHRMPI
jgi:uncharacterized protein YfaQ (DUF2300 family)